MRLLKKTKYHLYASIGVIGYVLCSLTLSKVSYRIKYDTTTDGTTMIFYYISEGLICGILAYALSNILLYYIEKLIVFNDLKKSAIWKMVLVFAVVIFVYSIIVWPLLDAAYTLVSGNSSGTTLFMKAANVPYFSTIFIIWMFVVIAIKAYHHINQVKISQLELESNLRESQLNTLKGQINPHFMFNSLNNIRGLILEDAPRSRDMITRLSEMLRYSLTKNGVNTISLKEELQTVDNYIEISKIQFEERLKFGIDVNRETLNIGIPPMVIQMLVENAVKHGIGNIKEGGEVNLKVDLQKDELVIIVENSGSLSITEGSTRLGLENIKRRLSLLYGNKASFILQENGNFVEAKIIIPLV
ncbi:sensor histidine kinase [Flavobacterium cerinum]|uniref:Histidine kinase n=1 Tax=Flavobacterium cerinum TaxID=2502784 RepID=A0A3S3QMD1_9FLAO|nr:histidine kinase [Flavobacterium cerinum]RWX02465.1 histidine kinase [Flavobacterium cerinum]